MVVVYIYDLEYIEAEELVRGTVFDGEDVESHDPTVSSVDECLVLLSVHAAFYGVFIAVSEPLTNRVARLISEIREGWGSSMVKE